MKTKVFDVSGLTEEVIREAQVMREPAAMKTVHDAMEKIEEAAQVLKNGGLVAFPTETVYGLGANAFDDGAVRRVYEAKGRPSDNPMIVHIARASDIGLLSGHLTPEIVKLADAFWPGPLTMVLEKREDVSDRVTGGLDTVGIRLPDSPIATELIRRAGVPVAAPSANRSGSPSPTKAFHVVKDLDGKVDIILAGPDSRIGIESTVVDMTVRPPRILRPGVITKDDIAAELGVIVEVDPALLGGDILDEEGAPRAPGMKYRHYAPEAEMLVVEGAPDHVRAEIERLKMLNERLGLNVGVLFFEEKSYLEAAHDFYSKLRELDETGVDLILAGALSQTDGVGFAVMNRMMKAAGYRVAKI